MEVPCNALNGCQKSKIPNAGTESEVPCNALNRYQKSKEYLRRSKFPDLLLKYLCSNIVYGDKQSPSNILKCLVLNNCAAQVTLEF